MIHNFISGHISKLIEKRALKKYLYIHVQSNIIHNSQCVNATQVFISGRMDKPSVANKHYGILFSLKKERNCDTRWNIYRHYTKENKPDTK
jgi:hypothetical protein